MERLTERAEIDKFEAECTKNKGVMGVNIVRRYMHRVIIALTDVTIGHILGNALLK